MLMRMGFFQNRALTILCMLAAVLAIALSGCAKESGQSAPSTTTSQSDPGVKFTPHRPALVMLSAQEVASKLEGQAAGSATPTAKDELKSAQFAASLEKHAHDPAVVRVVREKIHSFDSIPTAQKPSFIILGAEALTVADMLTYSHALRSALRDNQIAVRIAALATVTRHQELCSESGIHGEISAMLASTTHWDPISAHWLTATAHSILKNAKVAGISDYDRSEILRAALSNPDLDLALLIQGLDHGLIQSILDRDGKSFSPSRAAQIRNLLTSGVHS